MRHWKQRYAFDADLIFARRMKLGICGVQEVLAGDDVTDEMKAILGRNRLKLWWESKRIALKDFDGDAGCVVPRVERIQQEALEQRIELDSEQRNLDVDHNLGGPSAEPDLEDPLDDNPTSPF